MCGIVGFFTYQQGVTRPGDRLESARRAARFMRARGPDGAGEWEGSCGNVWFGHRRLAIIDLSDGGAQPMQSRDGGCVVTFNGEIYNFRALRDGLESKGHRFSSDSDTEVLLELYRSRGADFVSELRGMFAFAVWDDAKGELLLGRDTYGIKPLYYSDLGGTVVFASSVKALLEFGVPRTPDPAGVAGYFVFGSVPEPMTLYKAVRAVPAGCTLRVSRNGVGSPQIYRSIPSAIREAERRVDGRAHLAQVDLESIRFSLLDSVKHHLVSDVPVGAFLSAGVDSGSLVGLMRDAGQREIRTVTLSYNEFGGSPFDEAPLAESISKYYGTQHCTRIVDKVEFHSDLPLIMAAMDQPSIDGINTWFVSKATRELGLKVAISGVGGDELLGGYSTFASVPRLSRRLSVPSRIAGLPALMSNVVSVARSLGIDVHPKMAGLLKYGGTLSGAYMLQRGLFLPDEVRELCSDDNFLAEGVELLDPIGFLQKALVDGPQSDFGRMAALETCFYLRNQLLRDTDWASMAHSLEVRTPLVDNVLLRDVLPMLLVSDRPSGKEILASAPSRALPDEIVSRRKTGFGIPIRAWLAELSVSPGFGHSDARHVIRSWARQVAKCHGIFG